ncbi:MAG TPA: adenylate/guanylate cyclase domain-containing protein [Methylomirabilota bacterium]
MLCPQCRFENRKSVSFCEECGAKLEVACPSCGAAVPPGRKFCGSCGQPLAAGGAPAARFASPESYTPKHLAEKILTSKTALEGERKQVTVLFADLKGSMELLADRDPEEASKLLDPVLEHMMEAVHRYEGTVNQVMGDGIMALFGAPLAHEDHAVRACYAALRMQDSIGSLAEELRQRHGLAVQIRVGLNSGEVVVRSLGSDLRMDYTAVGQTTHLAARMEQLAPPGQIFLTEPTQRLVEGYVAVKSLGLVPVKGLAAPVAIYELKGPGPIRSRLQLAAARGLSRFVGRDAELGELSAAMEQARGGHGQVVALVGEPGVGKSRLVREFTSVHLPAEWWVLEAFATSFDTSAAYLPMISLLRGYFDVQEWDDARAIRGKVTAALLDLDQSLLRALPVLLTLLDVPVEDLAWESLDPRQRRQRTLDAIRRLLIRESQRRPLCLVIEDLHWIDPEAQAVLDVLVDSLPGARILLLVTYRPEYKQGWSQKSYCAQIAVHPLPHGMAEELLRGLLGDGADMAKLRAQLIERTEGNPFFLEESVRHLVETGALSGERGAYRPGRWADTVEVPATVQALLAARIDRLPSKDKRVLQCAAVIGKDIPLPLLEAIAEVSEDELRRSVHHLQEAEFLYETSLFPVFEYTFKHALTLDVAFGTLLQDRRRTLDARLVEALEQRADDLIVERIERLAHHAFRGGVWDKAVTYSREAGRRAFARSAHRTAVRYFEQALKALQHLPEIPETIGQGIDLRFDLRASLSPLGDFGRMLDYMTEAERLAEALGDRRRLGLVASFLANLFTVMLDLERAVEYGERAVAIASELHDTTVMTLANNFLGMGRYSMGEFPAAIELARRNVALLQGDLARERFGMPLLPAVYSRTVLAWSLAELGNFDEAAEAGREAIRIAETVDHPYTLVFACLGLATVHLRRGEFQEAITHLERAVRTCRTGDVPGIFALVASPLASAYCLAGRADAALDLLKKAIEQAIAIGDPFGHLLRAAGRAEAYLLVGRAADALPLAQRGVEICKAVKSRGVRGWALRLMGEVAAAQTPPLVDEAEAAYREALKMAQEMGMRPLEARCHLGLGGLYRRTGEGGLAVDHLTTARSMFREMSMRYWLEKAEAESHNLA